MSQVVVGGNVAVNADFFGQDAKVQKAIAGAKNVAVTRAPVLINGEEGTGKRSLAQFIHQSSSRSEKSFEVVDCGLEASEVERMILGHRDETDGRFIRGAIERNNGGTVVLANIDALEDEFQKRLFKILQELKDYDIDVRIISTSTRNISKLVGAGRFFRSLYTFISSVQLHLTPLRDRQEDIDFLGKIFINKIAAEMGKNEIALAKEVQDKLIAHYFGQNLSELKSILYASIEQDLDGVLGIDDLVIGEKKPNMSNFKDETAEGLHLMSLREAEKLLIKKALIHTAENRTQAAKILGVSIRTLRNKINEYRSEGANYFVNLR